MRSFRTLSITGVLMLFGTIVAGQNSISISGGGQTVQGLGSASFGVDMTNDAEVEGFVVAVSYDNSAVAITDLSTAGTETEAAAAELVVPEILGAGFTVGVVLDATAPFDGQTIAVGADQNICNFTAQSVIVLGSSDPNVVTGFDFVDGSFNTPVLDNILVQGGQAIGVAAGLILNGDTTAMSIGAPPPATLTIEDTTADSSGNGSVRILLENSGESQGFVLAIAHDGAELTLESIDLAGTETEAVGAEFSSINTYSDGGTIGVVLDFGAPFDGQTIGAGVDIHIANYNYSDTVDIYFEGDPIPADQVAALGFSDGTFGMPALNNVVVTGGLSVSPDLMDGTFTTPPDAIPAEDTVLWMEAEFTGGDATVGETGALCFYYADADDNIQGMTMTGCYDCDLTVGSTWDWGGSIVEEVGVEYLAVQIDDDGSDGDGCELMVAILLDALPPFEGQTLPQTRYYPGRLLIGCLSVTVDDTAECNTTLEINWCNGINGNGTVSLYNNVVIEFESIQIYERHNTTVNVVPEEIFQRGDCNSDNTVDLADAAAILANQFGTFDITCSDACDVNDDGLLNMADSVAVLNWLFKDGAAPPAPGPIDDGPDETEDSLPGCDSDDTSCA